MLKKEYKISAKCKNLGMQKNCTFINYGVLAIDEGIYNLLNLQIHF